MARLRILLLFLLWPAVGSAVFTVVVRSWPGGIYAFSRQGSMQLRINDFVCFRGFQAKTTDTDDSDYLACGQVLRITERGLIVSMTGSAGQFKIGRRLDMIKSDLPGVRETGLIPSKFRDPIRPFDQRSISLGTSLFNPFVHFEQGITRNISLGFIPQYISMSAGRGTVTGIATQVSFNYYFDRLFHGPWILGGLGWYLCRANVLGFEVSNNTWDVFAAGGWRYLFSNNFHVGGALGLQVFVSPNPTNLSLNWSGLVPFAAVQGGYRF